MKMAAIVPFLTATFLTIDVPRASVYLVISNLEFDKGSNDMA